MMAATVSPQECLINDHAEDERPVPPPPGWYADPDSGARRWWDGHQWGPVSVAKPSSSSSDSKLWAVLVHLGIAVFAIVVPLVVYLTVGKEDPDVRHHAREALNFQISFFIVWLLGFVLTAVTMVGSAMWGGGREPPVSFFLMFPLMFLLFFLAFALSIYGAVQAGRDRRWRYPVSLRFVGRAEDRDQQGR